MPRKKVVIKFLADAKKREATYKKRIHTLIKKTSELDTLCGVQILAVGVKPGTAGAGGKGEITTWPEDRGSLMALAKQFRELPPAGIKKNLNIGTYLQGELGKHERKLVEVRECMLDDVLTTWNSHLHDLSLEDHIALHRALGETLERAQRSIAELGSMDVVDTSGVTAAAPALQHAPAFLDNSFDLNLSDAGSSTGSQDHYYLPPDMLPQPVPVQSNYIGFQLHMHPPPTSFGEPPTPYMPFPMAPSPGFSFTCGDINIMNRLPAARTCWLDDDFAMEGLILGNHREFQSDGTAVANHQEFQSADAAMAYHQDFHSYSFDSAGTGAGTYGFDATGTGAETGDGTYRFAAGTGAGTGDGGYGFAAGNGAGAYGFDAAGTGTGTGDGGYGFAAAGTDAGAYGFDTVGTGAGTGDGGYGFAAAGTGAGAYGCFDVAGTGARYELEPHATGALGTPNNPVDAAAYELRNDTVLWLDNGGQLALGEQEEPSRLRGFDGWM